MTLSIPFGFSSTAADVLEGVDLANRNVIVTGGAAGIGLETSRALAAAGAAVTIAARRPDEAEKAVAELKKSMPEAQLRVRRLDLADLSSVQQFSENWTSLCTFSSTMRASWPFRNCSGLRKDGRCSSRRTIWGISR